MGQKTNVNWRDAYKLPLQTDEYYSYFFDAAGNVALNCSIRKYDNQTFNLYERLLDKINNDDSKHKFKNVSQKGDTVYINGETVFEVRGFGRLIGSAGFCLSCLEARAVQEEFAKWIVERLKR